MDVTEWTGRKVTSRDGAKRTGRDRAKAKKCGRRFAGEDLRAKICVDEELRYEGLQMKNCGDEDLRRRRFMIQKKMRRIFAETKKYNTKICVCEEKRRRRIADEELNTRK